MKYFDYAASCPLDEEAAQLYVQTATQFFGNSSSIHDIGSQASQLIENCRRELADLLGIQERGLYFTSGGSEANYLGIQALCSSPLKPGKHIITGIAEHASIHSTLEKLKQSGYEITYLPFHSNGKIDVDLLAKSIREDTILVSIQHGNSEIGTIQPIREIAEVCRRHDILIHTDCVQTFGKIDLSSIARIVDSLSISAHKFYGPKGIGALYIQPSLHWLSYYPQATHEKGMRPGTVNTPAIVAMTHAAQQTYQDLQQNHDHFVTLRQNFHHFMRPFEKNITIYPSDLPSIVGIRIAGLEGQFVMLECNRRGFAISTGSACQVGKLAPSQTMTAIGVPEKEAKEFIRLSFGRGTTLQDVREIGELLVNIAKEQG